MKKIILWILTFVMFATCAFMTACGETTPGANTPSEPQIVPPKKSEVVQARKNAIDEVKQGYDFTLNFTGSFNILGFEGSASANYDGQYRENKSTGNFTFKRVTSGLLLFDSTAYVYNEDVNQVKVVIDDDGKVKKAEIMPADEQELFIINKPIVAIIDGVRENNIDKVEISDNKDYQWMLNLKLDSDNALLKKAIGLLDKLGTNVSFNDVSFTNPVNGVKMYFDIDDKNRLNNFEFAFNVTIPIKSSYVSVTLSYKQRANNSTIYVPAVNNLIMGTGAIYTEVSQIKNSINSYKTDEAYSLDLIAENEFDPAWNITATVDKFHSRLYKKTEKKTGQEDKIWFNNSYLYKAHHEEDGAENYKYTIGNAKDGNTYIVSRKGSNVVTPIEGKSADERFEYLTQPIMTALGGVSCIKKVENGKKTTYFMYLKKDSTMTLQDTIVDLINSNEAEGVVDVNNYFNSKNFTIKDALIKVTMEDGKVTLVECETDLNYAPTGGEYTEYNITLTNLLTLKINDKLSKAQDYNPPSDDGRFLGIGSAIYCIV